jgi:methyltransferase (TIGR00027 family)
MGSKTAELVCMARAMAHGTTDVEKFSDPTALVLLHDDARRRIELIRAGTQPKTRRERIERKFLEKRASMMVARTVAIDEAIRAASAPQLVILGSGLDGRAFRMPELRDTVVFEVDHPDTQRDKRARLGALTALARDVRFVPVDFTRDDLDTALDAAHHDPAQPTNWIWEGVVMYLTRADVEATLSIVTRRSAAGSRLIVAYISPAPLRWIVGLAVRRLGEPFRSVFTCDAMRGLLEQHGFRVLDDRDVVTIARALSPKLGRDARAMRHLRIVTAEVVGAPPTRAHMNDVLPYPKG